MVRRERQLGLVSKTGDTTAQTESCLFFQLYLYHYLPSLHLHEVENCRGLFFQEIMFF